MDRRIYRPVRMLDSPRRASLAFELGGALTEPLTTETPRKNSSFYVSGDA